MKTIKILCLGVAALNLAPFAAAMETISDEALSSIDGGFNVIVNDFYIDSDNFSSNPLDRHPRIRIASDIWNESEISELRLHKAQSLGGGRSIGADLGTASDPLRLELRPTGLHMIWPTFMDKLDVHFRVDSRREVDLSNAFIFDSIVDIKDLHMQNAEFRLWAETGKGMQMRSKYSLSASELRVQTVDPLSNPSAAQIQAATFTLYNINLENLSLGTDQQPLFLRSFRDSNNLAQIQFEIAPLTLANPRAPAANIYIQSLDFGDFLWSSTGYSMPPGVTRPFTPPAGQNLVSIKGMEVQHLRITTQDIL